jgi:hypothetical protein
MRQESSTSVPQPAPCLENNHTITATTGDSFACTQCGMAFRSEQRDPRLYPTTENLLGRKFERLRVIDFAGYKMRGNHLKAHWQCRCIEGNLLIVEASNLKQKKTKSCGCLGMEKLLERSITHGKRHTPEYTAWHGMIQRCEDPNKPGYENYGGRGITVSEPWHNFAVFYADMGQRPSPQHSVERKDNSQGYSKENCLWATRLEQSRNRRNNILITYQGREQCLAAWAKELGMKRHTLAKRIKDGWPIEDAFTFPVGNLGHHQYRKRPI